MTDPDDIDTGYDRAFEEALKVSKMNSKLTERQRMWIAFESGARFAIEKFKESLPSEVKT